MDYTIDSVEGKTLSKIVNFEFSKDEFDKIYNKKLNEYTKDKSLKIPGFRPGKLPLAVVKQYRGQQAQSETINTLLNQAVQELAKTSEKEVASINEPKVSFSDTNSTKYLTISCVVDYYPEFALRPLSELEIEYPEIDLDETVETLLLALRKQRATFELTENPAQLDDLVCMDIECKDSEGNIQKGLCTEDAEFHLGSTQFPNEFTTNLLGAKGGDEVKFEIPAEEGKAYHVTVKVKRVLEMKLPELDEEFIDLFLQNKTGDVDTLKEEIRKNVSRELELYINSYIRPQIQSKLIEQYKDLELPEGIIKDKRAELLKQVTQSYNERRAALEGKDPASLEMLEKSYNDYIENNLDKQASSSILINFVYPKVFEALQVELSEEEVEKYLDEVASMYEEPELFKKDIKKDSVKLANIREQLLTNKLNKAILEQATVKNTKMTYTDLVKLIQPSLA